MRVSIYIAQRETKHQRCWFCADRLSPDCFVVRSQPLKRSYSNQKGGFPKRQTQLQFMRPQTHCCDQTNATAHGHTSQPHQATWKCGAAVSGRPKLLWQFLSFYMCLGLSRHRHINMRFNTSSCMLHYLNVDSETMHTGYVDQYGYLASAWILNEPCSQYLVYVQLDSGARCLRL